MADGTLQRLACTAGANQCGTFGYAAKWYIGYELRSWVTIFKLFEIFGHLAGAHLLPEAEARNERRLEAVRCPGRIGDYSTNPPTEPYVKMSLIRFLGTARFHTARLPDIADNPRPLSPSALQHNLSQLLCVPGDLPGTIPTLSRSWAAAAGTLPSSAPTLAMSSAGLHGGSASTATRALPPRTPGRGLGCCTARRHTGSTLAASHTGRRTVPGVHGGGCPGTNASTRPGCGGAACPPSSV